MPDMQSEDRAPLTPESQPVADGEDLPGADAPVGKNRFRWVLIISLVWIVIDQLTKIWAVQRLTGSEPIDVIPGVVEFRLLYNSGAAFSIGTGNTWIFTILATVVVSVVLWQATKVRSIGWAWALALLIGGAGGNLVDRLVRDPSFAQGHVVDFIAFPNFPVFNIADIGVTSAAVLIALLSWRGIGLDGTRLEDEKTSEPGAGASDDTHRSDNDG